ncbi:hypothetical protein GCM10011343_25700 [Flavobacterium orientale]|uniref:Fibronectin type-III domain-containing protein n=1 Tax=Flavobacterium orientale TaxID=1756020 RepID=A0A916Y8K4_9FLAO|nr:hypothetical protein GCM10011343_25700 [Flavobacterium orientale]
MYSFAQSTETYTEISGGTVLGTATTPTSFDSQNWTIAAGSIPFDFNYNGVNYTGCTVNSNGFITFGATAPDTFLSSPISSATAYSGAVSAWGGDLVGVFVNNLITAETRWEVVGDAPNREFVIQFKNWRPSYSSSVADISFINFQIRLSETTNQIKIVYGPTGYAIGTLAFSGTRQIGLRGAANTDFKTRTNTAAQLFTASAAGTLNSSSQAFNTVNATPGMPTNGLTYTYTPPVACSGTPVAGTVAPAVQNVCVGGTPAVLRLTGNSEGFTGVTFQWETSADNVAWENATGASATTQVYSPPAFAGPDTVYYRCKITCSNSELFSFSNAVTVNPAANPTAQATNLAFTNITYFGFAANWTNADGNRRVVYVSDAPIVDPTNGNGPALVANTTYAGTGQQIVFDGTGTAVTVTGLTLNTQYYVKVIEYLRCGSAAPFDFYYNPASVSNAATVTTSSATPLPWEEGFATTTLPTNWLNPSSWSISNTVTAINPALNTNYISRNLYSFVTTANFITPIFEPVPANYRYTFNYKLANFSSPYAATPENSCSTIIAISTDNGLTYTDVETIINNGAAGWQVHSLNLAAYTGQSIRIRMTSNWIAGDYYIAFDNFKIEAIPSCTESADLTVTSIGMDSAVLGWTEGGTATSWEIQYGAPGFALGSGTTVVATENPFTLTGLTENTNYAYYVRAVCSVSDQSPWTGPLAFKTTCADKTDYIENFDSLTSNFSTTMPDCWSRVLVGTPSLYVTTGSALPMSPSNRLYMFVSSTATPAQQAYAVLPSVSNLSAGTHRLRFKAFSTQLNRFLEVGYMTDPTDISTFVSLEEITIPGTVVANTQQFVVIPPASIPAGVKHLVILNPGFPGETSTVYIDDVSWEVIPTCIEPSGVTLGSVLATTATLNWTAASPAPAEGYEYYLATTSTNPDAATVPTGAVAAGITTANLTDLTPATVYYVWVRSVCTTSDKSAWTLITTFATPCASFVPYYLQDFTTYTSNATLEALCWSRYGSGDQLTGPTGGTNTGSWTSDSWLNGPGTTGAVKINLYTNFIRGWIVSPIFDLATGGYQVKYKVGVTTWNGTAAITMGSDDFVYFMMSTDAGTTWTILDTFSATNTPSNLGESKVYNIPTVNTETVKFAFFGTDGTVDDTPDYDFFIDDFEVQAIPVSAPACATNVTATTDANCGNVATVISWDPASGSDGYKLTVGTTTGGNDVLDNFVVGGTSYPFVGNLNTTYYFKVVPFNANGDATGCLEQSFTTAIEGCACIPSSTNTSDYISNFSTTNAAVNLVFPNAAISPGGYGNYYNTQSISHFADSSFNFSNTFVGGSNGLRIWVDWNNNFTFEDSEVVFYQVNADLTKTGTITVPAGTADGNYRMRVRAQWGSAASPTACGSITWGEALDFKLIIDNTLSTGGFDLTNFSAYPNPVKDVFNFTYTSTISDLVIYNLLGQQVLATKPNATQGQVDMSSFPNGTYLVKVTSENQTKTIKVIKN